MNNKKKSISIIAATYNAESCLENLIASLIPQKNNEVEFIIIDGSSTDNTLEIIRKHKSYIDFWKSEPDKGIYDAWNKGINVAKGEWIMFLGADDELLPDSINKYLNLLASKDLSSFDYISAQNEYVNDDGKLIKLLGKGAEWRLLRKGNSAAHVGSLHNKMNLFREVGDYNLNYKICADYEILLRKNKNLKSYFLDAKIAKMKVGGMSFSVKAIKEAFEIRKQHQTISCYCNYYLFLRDCLAFEIFKLRKRIN